MSQSAIDRLEAKLEEIARVQYKEMKAQTENLRIIRSNSNLLLIIVGGTALLACAALVFAVASAVL